MAVRLKERELAAVGISVAAGCKPCTDHHVNAAREAGASDEQIRQAVEDAVSVRKSATEVMQAHALAHVGGGGHGGEAGGVGETNRIQELVSVGAAFAVNCVSNLEKHLAAAGTVGISQEEIAEIVKLAARIKERAASHAERPVGMTKEDAP